MPVSGDRRRERELLRADQERLGQMLRGIAADTKAASELAASVQQRLAEELEERRRAAEEAEEVAVIDPDLEGMLASVEGLHLQLLFEPDSRKASVDLPLDATVADLWATVHSAGGPVPPLQVLSVGGQRLLFLGGTPLSATRLIRQYACVTVRRRDPRRRCIDVGYGGVATMLESGEVWCSGSECDPHVCEDFAGAESVHCGDGFCSAVVAGRLQVKHWRTSSIRPATLRRLYESEIVCCSAGASWIAAVDSGGQLVVGDVQLDTELVTPAALDGRVAAVSVGDCIVALLTRDGDVCVSTCGARQWDLAWMQPGGTAVAVSAGRSHCAALMDDGSVRCFGRNDEGQCDVPVGLRDVVSVECSGHYTVALRADGRLSWWGRHAWSGPDGLFPAAFSAGRVTAIAAQSYGLLTVTADGRLSRYLCGDDAELPFAQTPQGRVAQEPTSRAYEHRRAHTHQSWM